MAWLSLMRVTGVLGPDMADTRALLVDDGIDQCIRDVQAREEDLDKQLRSTLTEARDALKKGQRAHARTCTARCQRYSLQLHRLRGMLNTLHTHKDVIDTTQLNMSVVGALKRSAVALSTWKKGTSVQDASEVDRVRQDLEVYYQCVVLCLGFTHLLRGLNRTTCGQHMNSLKSQPVPWTSQVTNGTRTRTLMNCCSRWSQRSSQKTRHLNVHCCCCRRHRLLISNWLPRAAPSARARRYPCSRLENGGMRFCVSEYEKSVDNTTKQLFRHTRMTSSLGTLVSACQPRKKSHERKNIRQTKKVCYIYLHTL